MTYLEVTPANDRETDHRNTCFHQNPRYELIKEAEQVAIFHDPDGHWTHISVRDHQWFSCTPILCTQYDRMTELQLLELVSEKLRFLRTLRE